MSSSSGPQGEPNGTFSVSALLVDDKLAAYLAATNRYSADDITWWTSTDLPPASRTVSSVQVERVSKTKDC